MFEYGGYYLRGNVGNNIFVYDMNPDVQLWIPELKEVNFNDIKNVGIPLGKEVSFEIKNKEGLVKYTGLEDFLYFKKNGIPIYVFDNHNHAFSFWRREVLKGEIEKEQLLLHIDQHSDLNENSFVLENEERETIVRFCNECCNVGNFIKPAIECGLLNKVKQLRTELGLLEYKVPSGDYILDIDLDFWDISMSIENMEETIKKTRHLIKKAKMVTIATSPYFLNQKRAKELTNLLLFK